jgi:serine/threonine-protein phosphatase 6 regulatory ankyrin repeat subunit B
MTLIFAGMTKAENTAKNTKLVRATMRGDLAAVKRYLDEGADINAYYNNATGLMYASQNGHTEVVRLLLDRGANPNLGKLEYPSTQLQPGQISTSSFSSGGLEDWATPLYWASKNGHADIVKLLLEKGADASIRTRTAKFSGADISVNGGKEIVFAETKKTPLEIASENGHKDIVQLLEKPTKEMGLIIASEDNNIKEVQTLLDQGADVNLRRVSNRSTALWIASYRGYAKLVKLLLEKGADSSISNSIDGITPIYVASQNGHTDIVRLLLDNGADVNAKEINKDVSALHLASQKGHTGVVQLLLDRGADVNAKLTKGDTALMIASAYAHAGIVSLLLENGADMNAQRTGDGFTALMFASQNGCIEVVQILIDKGADVNIKGMLNNREWSALKAAKKNGRKKTAEILRLAGAKE